MIIIPNRILYLSLKTSTRWSKNTSCALPMFLFSNWPCHTSQQTPMPWMTSTEALPGLPGVCSEKHPRCHHKWVTSDFWGLPAPPSNYYGHVFIGVKLQTVFFFRIIFRHTQMWKRSTGWHSAGRCPEKAHRTSFPALGGHLQKPFDAYYNVH